MKKTNTGADLRSASKTLVAATLISVCLVASACGRNQDGSISPPADAPALAPPPATDGNGAQNATPEPVIPPSDEVEQPPPNDQFTTIKISQAIELRTNQKDILEKVEMMAAGTVIQLSAETTNLNYDYRNSKGQVERSSTGFLHPFRVLSMPGDVSQAHIDQLNLLKTGLYVSAVVERDVQGTQGNFAVVPLEDSMTDGFTKFYSESGKPKKGYTGSINKRFPGKVNKGVDPAAMSEADRVKYQRIFAELVKVANRATETPKSLLMIPLPDAQKYSVAYEQNGSVNPIGAWSVAVEATAVRHDFANVPCAEFQSEIARQAYQRAGYSVHDDFNATKGNKLIWTETAAVVGFSAALVKAGWVPWDPTVYKPMTGAFLFNTSGTTPGHTYISAGHNGQLIVDNGAPQGRNLRKTVEKTIDIMFQTGLFILPPGINPEKW